MTTVKKLLIGILVEVLFLDELPEDTDTLEELGCDLSAEDEVLERLEGEFGVPINVEDGVVLRMTVGALTAYLEGLLGDE